MTKNLFLIILSLYSIGCAGMQVTKSGFGQSDENLSFFPLVSASKFKEAYSLLCPALRSATDYRAFVTTLSANPYVSLNGDFEVVKSQSIVGSGVKVLTGWLSSIGTIVPVEMTVGNQENTRCLLGVTVLGSSILPPFGLVAPPALPDNAYLSEKELKATLLGAKLTGALVSGPKIVLHYNSDGTRDVLISASEKDTLKDTGNYRIEGNRVCGNWKVLNGGKESCAHYLRRPDGNLETYDVDEGFLQSRLGINKGSCP